MLWLCLHLTQLPLDALHAESPESALAVVDARQRLVAVNAAATEQGLAIGMRVTTALALVPELVRRPRDTAAEAATLEALAGWCGQFTSWVSLLPPQSVLLEVGASRRLFGGLKPLWSRIQDGLAKLGLQARMGCAPTPGGAALLARHGRHRCITTLEGLRDTVAPYPLEALDWDAKTTQRLHAVGVRTVSKAWTLPRDGFARRYGTDKRLELDRLLGTAPDPRPAFVAPPTYARRLELTFDTDRHEHIGHAADRLFGELAGYLRGRDCGTGLLHLELEHPGGTCTPLTIGLRAVSRDADQWRRLLNEQLQRTPLPDAVRALRVHAQKFSALQRPQTSLLPTVDSGERRALLEQLAARLGPSALYSVSSTPDHRPECAHTRSDPEQGANRADVSRPRPLLLLETPQPVDYQRLQLLTDPERLETGWWDRSACRRDYYHARLPDGRYVWVYRSHDAPGAWFIHGLCG